MGEPGNEGRSRGGQLFTSGSRGGQLFTSGSFVVIQWEMGLEDFSIVNWISYSSEVFQVTKIAGEHTISR